MKSGFQRDKLAQARNSSSQMKVVFGTAENVIQTANYAKYANEIKKLFRVFGVFRGSNFSLSTTQIVRRKVGLVKVEFFMTPRLFNTLTATCWTTLLLCVFCFFVFAVMTPEVSVFDSTKQDDEVKNIRSETNIVFLQQRAAIDVELAGATNDNARTVCYLALVVFLVIIVSSYIGLLQVRRMKKLLKKSDAEVEN